MHIYTPSQTHTSELHTYIPQCIHACIHKDTHTHTHTHTRVYTHTHTEQSMFNTCLELTGHISVALWCYNKPVDFLWSMGVIGFNIDRQQRRTVTVSCEFMINTWAVWLLVTVWLGILPFISDMSRASFSFPLFCVKICIHPPMCFQETLH